MAAATATVMDMASCSRLRLTSGRAFEPARDRSLWVRESPMEHGLVGRDGAWAVVGRGDGGSVVYVTVGEAGGVWHTATPTACDDERGQHGEHEGRRGLGRQWWQWRRTSGTWSRVQRLWSGLVQRTTNMAGGG